MLVTGGSWLMAYGLHRFFCMCYYIVYTSITRNGKVDDFFFSIYLSLYHFAIGPLFLNYSYDCKIVVISVKET